MYRQIFCDFGESFTVIDSTGEPPVQYLVESISKVRVYSRPSDNLKEVRNFSHI